MNKAPPPIPKSYQRHKLERASLVEVEMENSVEIPKSVSNNSLPNICVNTTTTTNEPPVANLLSFSPPPTPPPRRRKQRGTREVTPKNTTLDVPDSGGTILDDHSSSDEVDTTSSSGSSSCDSPTVKNMVAPPLPPRSELSNYVTMLQPNTMDLPPTEPPPLPPRDELMDSPVLMHNLLQPDTTDLPPLTEPPPLPPRDADSPVCMHNSSSAPPLPSRNIPSVSGLRPRCDAIPTVPPRDKKRISPNTSRKAAYTPPVPHRNIDLGPRRNSAEAICSSPDISLIDVEDIWKSEDFGEVLAHELLSQASRSSFTEEIAKKLQSNFIMRPSKAVMDTLSNDDSFSLSLPPPLIPSTSSSPQVNRKTDDTVASSDPLDLLLDKSDLTKWVTTSSNGQQPQEKNATPTANGNVLT